MGRAQERLSMVRRKEQPGGGRVTPEKAIPGCIGQGRREVAHFERGGSAIGRRGVLRRGPI
eukprot:4912482-Lingulodinium_polyedra.AAC.1